MCAPLHGQPAPLLPLEVRYEASEGCPTGAELEAELAARGLRHRAPGPDERSTRLTIRVRQGSEGSDGEAEVRQLDGGVSRRSLQGATCSEVLQSLTLVAALALSPFVTPPPAASPGAGSASPAPSQAPPVSPSAPAPASAPPLPVPPPPVASSQPAPRAPDGTPATWSLGLQAALQSELAPGVSPGAMLWLERRTESWPTLRMALGGFSGGTTDVAVFRASFRAYLAQASGCWPGGVGARWTASACVELQGGWLAAEGSRAPETSGVQRRAWLAPGAGGRLGARVGGRGRLEVAGALLVPVRRDRFVFEIPRAEAHRVGPVVWQLGIGAGVDFW